MKYEEPVMKIIVIEDQDIITLSEKKDDITTIEPSTDAGDVF